MNWGTILSIFFMLGGLHEAYSDYMSFYRKKVPIVVVAFRILGDLAISIFSFLALIEPGYIGGKPSFKELAPALASPVLYLLGDVCLIFITSKNVLVDFSNSLLYYFIPFVILYFMYSADDDSRSFCLCSKPWIYKRKRKAPSFNPVYPKYPPQPFIYPQGYPPQQQAYHPQAYPPQQAYPPHGYPPQGYPRF